jgi:signal transduction histidine kinase/DNA-binding response OmpR family regulator
MLRTSETNQPTRHDLEQIRGTSLDVLLLVMTVPAVAWILFVPWDEPPRWIRSEAWYGVLTLWMGVLIAWTLREKHTPAASVVFASAVFTSTVLLTLGTGMQAAPYGFAVLVFIVSAVLTPRAIVAASAASLAALLYIGEGVFLLRITSLDILGPLTVTLIGTAVSLLSAHNLSKSLAWVSVSLNEAWQHAEEARDRSGDLARALKALDESSYRIQRLNHQLQLALQAAREAEELKARFAANISHELRTPLNLIVGFAALLFEHPEMYELQYSPRCLHDLSIIYRNALQLQSLVNDVLDLSQIHAARMAVVPESVDPIALIHETIDTIRNLLESKNLSLIVETPPDLPPIQADRTRIRQVLINLLNNALRFTDEGQVTVRVEHQDEEIIFSVEDTGVGIPAYELPHLFREFHQLDSGLSRRCGGAGLGLAISKAFVELHGGKIWVESDVGKGSAFRFSLPVVDKTIGTGGRLVASRRAQPARESIVLALTHSERALRLLRRYLAGWQVVMARDIAHARHLIQEVTPQWLIVDRAAVNGLPDRRVMSSLHAYHRLMLLCDLPQDTKELTDPGIMGYLIKPTTNEEVLQALRQFGSSVEQVLVVDDDRDFAQLITKILTLPPRVYQVLRAYSASEALSLALRRTPDVILLDLGLPDMPGAELLNHIRREPSLASVPVIVITGKVASEETGQEDASTSTDLIITSSEGMDTAQLFDCIRHVVEAVRD